MNKKILKLIGLFLLIIILSGLARWLELTLPPSFKYSNNFDLNKKVQTFDISLKDGNYRLGFYIGKVSVIGKKNDGEYFIEYTCNNKIVRKVKNLRIQKDENVHYDDSNRHTMIFIDEFNIPNNFACNKFKLKINTKKNFSLFDKLNIENPTTLYIRSNEYAAKFTQAITVEKEKFRKKYPKDFKNFKVDYLNDNNVTKLSLMEALLKKDLESVKDILHKHDINISIEMGETKASVSTQRTPLVYASYFNDLATVKYLLKNGADINQEDFIKKTPIQYAIENNATKSVKYLLEQGADINATCFVHEYKEGTSKLTPLTYAIKNEFYEITKLLLEYGFRKIDLDCKGVDLYGDDDAFVNAWAKVDGFKRQKVDKSSKNPFAKETKVHIYQYLYRMQYPVRFLKLFKEYGLKDEKYEKDYTKEWFKEYYNKCKTGIYGGKCIYILDNNITIDELDVYKYYEIVGHETRNTNNKRNK